MPESFEFSLRQEISIVTVPLDSAIVRIRTTDDCVVGAGFLVGQRQVLTCAHVVAQALGLPDHVPEMPQDEVRLDFPLVAPNQELTARVVCWQAAYSDGTGDIAGLELTDTPPAGVSPAHLARSEDPWGHHFRAFGFPAGYDNGVWASGRMLGSEATGWVQIEDLKQSGYFVAPGFSGGPVWDEASESVVGMIVAAESELDVRAAFLIPMDVLVKAWPDVLGQALLDADMERLRARRDQADRRRREMRERQRVVNVRPLDVTHTFKDRLSEMQALCNHLADSSVRLVSVVGRGGMGKTALASRVLADLERGVLRVPGEERVLSIEGILYLSARSTGLSLERIYADVGRMLGEPAASKLARRWAERDTPLAAKVEYLLETLQDGLYLILLDNLEDHLTEEGDIADEGLRLFIQHCLTQPSGARLVVTSREQVRITAEALAKARSIPLHEGLPEEEAIALLRDLDPQGDLGLRDALEEDLRRAVQFTQGVPRALELLAGILDRDPSASLPRLLADERLFGEQVVEQLVAEGHRRLGDSERWVMQALAVFDRPVEATAVAYLLHPWYPALDVHSSLRRLVGGYFVGVSRVTCEYNLHPLDRDYAYRQLPHPPVDVEESDIYTRRNLELRAADFYASIRKPESEWKTIDDLAPQLAEFEHRIRVGDYDTACGVLELIDYNYLYLWGYYALLVELRMKLLGSLTDFHLQAANLSGLGRAYYSMAQFKPAILYHKNALAVARQIGDHEGEGRHLGNLGKTYRAQGQFEQAIELYEKALVIAREIGDRWSEGIQLTRLGLAYRALGQIEQAITCYEEALTIAHEISDRWEEGDRLGNLGSAYRLLGRLEQAIEFYEKALTVATEVGDRRGACVQVGRLGVIYRDLGQRKRAIELIEKALVISREIGDRQGEGLWLGQLGLVYYDLGQLEMSIEFLEGALAIVREINDRWGENAYLLGLGKAHLVAGRHSKARDYLVGALVSDVPETSYKAALAVGTVLLHRGDTAASRYFAQAIARCQILLDKTPGLYEPRYALAAALVGQSVCDPCWAGGSQRANSLTSALAEYQQALHVCAAPGVVQDALRDLELIRAAGIEGLEPVFELLEGAVTRNVQ
jgi:tetratricopeptide (TPR) repeat protein